MPRQRGIDAGAGARNILTGRADVEQADLVREEDAQRAHQQRSRLDERIAEILDAGGCLVVGQEVLHDVHNGLARALGIDEQQNDVADQEAQQNTDQRSDE